MSTPYPDGATVMRMATRDALRELDGPALASAVLLLIEDHQDRWNQSAWRENGQPGERYEDFREDPLNPACKTSFCVAGWVAAIDGVKWVAGDEAYVADPARCTCRGAFCQTSVHQIATSTYAEKRLGLTVQEGDALFDGDNSLADVRDLIGAIVRGEDLLGVEVEHSELRECEPRARGTYVGTIG